jgi:predicted DNA-binding protein
MTSPAAETWKLIQDTLAANAGVMALVDMVYDKVGPSPWKGKKAYISRGPAYVVDDGAECIDGLEITFQVDVWSQKPNRWQCDDIVEAVRKALHERDDLQLAENALLQLQVTLSRVIDDPDPLTVHGIIQVTATVERPGGDD